MAIDEVVPNPLVQKVIFQIRFPNLFYLEQRIGDYQTRVMERFPESKLLTRRAFFFGVRPEIPPDEISPPIPASGEPPVDQVWQFRSERGVALSILSSSLDLSSECHRTYDKGESEDQFREAIRFAVDAFLEVVRIPKILRIGLRYIDACPIPAKENVTLQSWFNTSFPLARFSAEDAEEMSFSVRTRRGGLHLTYRESLKVEKDIPLVYLDFDAFSTDIPAHDYLAVTDELHRLLISEFEGSIRGPVYERMRTPKE